jgi:hypothetical protein
MVRRHNDDIGLFLGTSSKRARATDRVEKGVEPLAMTRVAHCAYEVPPIAQYVTPVTLARDKCHGRPSRTGVRYKDRYARKPDLVSTR